jgi:hypothetical protein
VTLIKDEIVVVYNEVWAIFAGKTPLENRSLEIMNNVYQLLTVQP